MRQELRNVSLATDVGCPIDRWVRDIKEGCGYEKSCAEKAIYLDCRSGQE